MRKTHLCFTLVISNCKRRRLWFTAIDMEKAKQKPFHRNFDQAIETLMSTLFFSYFCLLNNATFSFGNRTASQTGVRKPTDSPGFRSPRLHTELHNALD